MPFVAYNYAMRPFWREGITARARNIDAYAFSQLISFFSLELRVGPLRASRGLVDEKMTSFPSKRINSF